MSRRQETSKTEETAKLKGFDDFDVLLGDIMRGERATLGKSLLDVQRELKIKANYIAAIENTDPSAFETPGFIAGYVRSYARYLGLDPEWAFKTFCAEGHFTVPHGMTSQAPKKPSSIAHPVAGGKKPAHLRDPFTEPSVSYLPKGEAVLAGVEPRAIGSMMILLALLCGIGYGGWAVLQEVQKVRFAPIDQTPEVLAEIDPVQSVFPETIEDAVAEATLPSEAFDRIYRPEALDVPVMVARDGPIASIDPNTTGTLAPKTPDLMLARVAPTPENLPFGIPGELLGTEAIAELDQSDLLPPIQVVEASSPSVVLLAVRPSWVRVTGADGTVVFEKILDAGETFEVPLTENAPTLRAGNAGSLYFAVNGATYGPAGEGPEVVKNIALEPEALQTAYAVADLDRDADLKRFVAVAEADISD